MMPQAVDDARRDDRSRCEGGENFHAETALRFRPHLHVHLAEYLRKDFHAMVVIDRKVNPEKPYVPLNKNDAFQKVQKRRVQEKR